MLLARISTPTARPVLSKPLDSESENVSTASTTESSSKADVSANPVTSKEPTASALLVEPAVKAAPVPLSAMSAPPDRSPTETALVPADQEL